MPNKKIKISLILYFGVQRQLGFFIGTEICQIFHEKYAVQMDQDYFSYGFF